MTQGLFPRGPLPPQGISRQRQNYYWYERTFRVTTRRQNAILVIYKAQFSMAVWVNGKKAGEHLGSYDSGRFDLSALIDWSGENQLVIRIGSHPAVLPADTPFASDGEKFGYQEGVYDGVELELMDNPIVESVQVAPKISSSEILFRPPSGIPDRMLSEP